MGPKKKTEFIPKPIFFETSKDLRVWFDENHEKATELWVGYYKVGTGKPSITWSESVDQALCFGWIDGIRKSLDAERYTNRFTPRKPKSTWSAVNIRKVETLSDQGLMKPAGLVAYEKREAKNSTIYSFEQKSVALPKDLEKIFKENRKAWDYFRSRPASYQRTAVWWIISAKQEQTKLKRLWELIADSEAERYVKPLRRPTKSA